MRGKAPNPPPAADAPAPRSPLSFPSCGKPVKTPLRKIVRNSLIPLRKILRSNCRLFRGNCDNRATRPERRPGTAGSHSGLSICSGEFMRHPVAPATIDKKIAARTWPLMPSHDGVKSTCPNIRFFFAYSCNFVFVRRITLVLSTKHDSLTPTPLPPPSSRFVRLPPAQVELKKWAAVTLPQTARSQENCSQEAPGGGEIRTDLKRRSRLSWQTGSWAATEEQDDRNTRCGRKRGERIGAKAGGTRRAVPAGQPEREGQRRWPARKR